MSFGGLTRRTWNFGISVLGVLNQHLQSSSKITLPTHLPVLWYGSSSGSGSYIISYLWAGNIRNLRYDAQIIKATVYRRTTKISCVYNFTVSESRLPRVIYVSNLLTGFVYAFQQRFGKEFEVLQRRTEIELR